MITSIVDYDVFVYTEDDILVRPKVIASYLEETERIQQLVGKNASQDYYVGVVRYEYPHKIAVLSVSHSTSRTRRYVWDVTVYHLSNKNWPRIGHYNNLTVPD